MAERESNGSGMRLSPAAGIAAAAAAASTVASCGAFLVWGAQPDAQGFSPLVVMPLILAPALVAASVWFAARRAIPSGLAPAIESLDRLADGDFSTEAAPAANRETAALALAVERCRAALAERQAAAKVHAAVARLMGAAVSRLAGGDLSARIDLELPEPYRAFRDDFNTAMEALEEAFGALGGPGARLREHAREIGEAAVQLERRAGKLAERIDTDLDAIENGGKDTETALRRVLYTLGGVRIATRRNAEAAERFAELGRLVAREAERLTGLVSGPAREADEAVRLPRAEAAA